MPRTTFLLPGLIFADLIVAIAIALPIAAGIAGNLPNSGLAHHLDTLAQTSVMPLVAAKLALLSFWHFAHGRSFWLLSLGWAWIAIAKLTGLHLILAPALGIGLSELVQQPWAASILLGKCAALSAIGGIALGFFLISLSSAPCVEAKRQSWLAIAGFFGLGGASILPEIFAYASPLIMTALECAFEMIAGSTILWCALTCRRSTHSAQRQTAVAAPA